MDHIDELLQSIADLIKPNYLHRNPAVRLAALDSLDTGTLFGIACKDWDATVAVAAGLRLSNDKLRAAWLGKRGSLLWIDTPGQLTQFDVVEIIILDPVEDRAKALLKIVSGARTPFALRPRPARRPYAIERPRW
jgi:hypothetical protein